MRFVAGLTEMVDRLTITSLYFLIFEDMLDVG
jgi:hypothetical protein